MRVELDIDRERIAIMNATLDAVDLKQLLKDTLSELLAERRKIFKNYLPNQLKTWR